MTNWKAVLLCSALCGILVSNCTIKEHVTFLEYPENTKKPDYTSARLATIEAWEEKFGRVTHKCYMKLKGTLIQEVREIMLVCPDLRIIPGITFIGCYRWRHNIMYIKSGHKPRMKEEISVHEYIHAISRCEQKDVQPNHEDPRLWKDAGGVDSVEIIAISKLD